MIKLRHIILAVFTSGVVLLLSGCHQVVVFEPRGVIADQERSLLIISIILMLIVAIPVIVATLFIARRYRASNTKAKYTPNWGHSNVLEVIWWTIPIIIIAILGTITWKTTHVLDPYKPLNGKALGITIVNKPLNIQVISLRWRWLFIYPKQDIATVDYVKFPVNTPINFTLTSDAPMNSFQIQQLAGQIYTMNGMQTKLHLMANQTGTFRGRSVSFSGEYFANMAFKAHVTSKQAFNKWVASVKHMPNTLNFSKFKQLAMPTQKHGTMFFSSVTPGLFNQVIAIYAPTIKHKVNTDFTGAQL